MILMPDSYGSLKNSLSVSSKSSARVQKQRYAPVRSPNAFSFSRSSPWRAAPDLDSPKTISTSGLIILLAMMPKSISCNSALSLYSNEGAYLTSRSSK